MQMMKERMNFMMNALKGRVSTNLDDLVHRTNSPFTMSVTSFSLPPKFHMPQVENYDRSKDPLDHLESFKTLMHLQRVLDEIMCRAFPITLKGSTRIWFSRLMPNSIGTIKELSVQFASHFIRGHKYKKSTACLMNIKQREDKTLRSYITCFNKETLSIDETNDKILMVAFTNGLRKGKLTSFTPLTAPIDQVLMQIKDEGALTFPGKLKGDPNKRSRDRYCHFHRDHDHDIADCYDLKQQIEALIKQRKLQRFVSKERADPLQEQAPRRENERPRLPLGDIRMIVGGTATTGLSKKARKTYLRMVHNIQLTGFVPKILRIDNPVIEFSEEDARRLHHSHDDALVISIRVGDYNTHRVLVDNGSLVDILYYPAFQQMMIDRERLVPMNALLVGFGGRRVHPLGAVTLSVMVGDDPSRSLRT
ncbi:uncharacterized protein LOC126728717 [Quercus robur]|uniref:uncharacterized protein LOC126728717 n=1 Tax=Quercus robur TaxID=38942 RepID=UPI0021637D15|nr:uncharacterized protein LOC126728717 [Quercus robur]